MPTFDLGLVKGPKGDPGDRGEQGIQGVPGPQGDPGYTPVRGTDYFTEADKQDIADAAAEKVINESVVGQILGIDTTPTSGSGNLVTSGGVYTSLQNNDPRQWGIGKAKNLTTADDINAIFENGFYSWGSLVPGNAPTLLRSDGSYQYMSVSGAGTNQGVEQTIGCYLASSPGKITRKKYANESFGPWEWVNPPMQIGVEYRTTERYQGKPVYVMAVDLGAAPNATTKDVTIKSSEVKKLVFASLHLQNGEQLPYTYNGHEVVFNTAVYSSGGLMIFIRSKDDQSMMTVTGIVKYTKITD